MGNEIETIYYLQNPETSQIAFATESQLIYEDIIKDIFGVANKHDLSMMIQYNKGFQNCICKSYGINEQEITLELIFRVASKIDLLEFKKQYIKEQLTDQNTANEENPPIQCPFKSIIRLQEGIFKWDEANSSYNMVKTAKV